MERDEQTHTAPYPTSADIYRQIVITLEPGDFRDLTDQLYAFLDRRRIHYIERRTIRELGIVWIQLSEDEDVLAALEELRTSPVVQLAEQNRELRLTGTLMSPPLPVNDPLSRFQWALDKISAPAAWKREASAASVVVAIIDTGISTIHPDLVKYLWDDGAGGHGFNVLTGTPDVEDADGHGTLLAGTIGAVSNNAIGIAGVQWPIKLMAVKFHDVRTPPDAFHGVLAIVWAVVNHAKVITAAWHLGLPLGFVRVAIEYANSQGVVFVAGAGNDGLDNDTLKAYPACYPVENVVSVMATNEHDDKPAFSNYGKTTVHLAAPGVRILSTMPSLTGPRWGNYGGTSAACALVANAAAVLKALNPAWTPVEIREHLMASVDTVPRWLPCIAQGRLNLGRAVCGPLTITAPLAGDEWQAGTNRQVTWTQTYVTPRCTSVRVRLSDDGGASYPAVLSGGQPAGNLTCMVPVPNRIIPNARIKLESEQGPGLFDESGVFRVKI